MTESKVTEPKPAYKVDEFGQIVKESTTPQTHEQIVAQVPTTPIQPEDQGEEFGDPLKALADLKASTERAVPFDVSQITQKLQK
jgi:hypothetical protein